MAFGHEFTRLSQGLFSARDKFGDLALRLCSWGEMGLFRRPSAITRHSAFRSQRDGADLVYGRVRLIRFRDALCKAVKLFTKLKAPHQFKPTLF